MRRFLSIYLYVSFFLLVGIFAAGVFFSVRIYKTGEGLLRQQLLSVRDTVKTYFDSSGNSRDVGLALKNLFKRLVDTGKFSAVMLGDRDGALIVEAVSGTYLTKTDYNNASGRKGYDIRAVNVTELALKEAVDDKGFYVKAVAPFITKETAVSYLVRALFVIGVYFVLNLVAAIGFAFSGTRYKVVSPQSPNATGDTRAKEEMPKNKKETEEKHNKDKKDSDPEFALFLDRLETEIKKSEYEAEDLSLVLARINPKLEGLVSDSRIVNLFGTEHPGYLLRGNTFVWIMRDRKINESLALIKDVYPELKKESGINTPAFFGISSRNSRLISAENLFKEAKSALAKALRSGSNPVFAFYADPDRYRDYLAKSASSSAEKSPATS